MKTITSALILAILLACSAWYSSPYLAAHDALAAAREGDVAKLQAYIDLDSVKSNMQDDITSSVNQSAVGSIRDLPFGEFIFNLSGRFIAASLDKIVNPIAIARLMDGRPIVTLASSRIENRDPVRYDWRYQSDHHYFELVVWQRNDSSQNTIFTFYRETFASWRIVAVTIPDLTSLITVSP